MKYNHSVKDFWRNSRKLLLTISCILALVLGWQGSLTTPNNTAYATPLVGNSHLLADLGSSGLGNQVKGRAQQDIGRTQSAIDDVSRKAERKANRDAGKVDATAQQVKGRAKQDIDRTQRAAEKTGNKVGDAAESAVDKVKNFFNP